MIPVDISIADFKRDTLEWMSMCGIRLPIVPRIGDSIVIEEACTLKVTEVGLSPMTNAIDITCIIYYKCHAIKDDDELETKLRNYGFTE